MTKPIKTYYESGAIQYERYIVNGKSHRLDGSAFISYHVNGDNDETEWWIGGIKYTFIDWLPQTGLSPEKQIELKLKYG